ncbi:NIF family HAD-type phosphatase [Desulfonatronum thiodismutans]|uniref:NIF family HAD-type phosphatase n=1 Tax=Desulfonatronum thiodismutans TaxID=159290 RepID=UPI0004ABEAC7|nr:NIF family HAD-type phosphatase [Desulfonatronum thiodismutans]
MARLEVLALDLEGTLVSNAVSQIARPGLHDFLEFCRREVPRLVLYTSVPERKVREVTANLVAEGSAPAWFKNVECVHWNGRVKDLTMIQGTTVERTLLIDDYEGYVIEEQRRQWLPIDTYSTPYSADDTELQRVRQVLENEWGCHAG